MHLRKIITRLLGLLSQDYIKLAFARNINPNGKCREPFTNKSVFQLNNKYIIYSILQQFNNSLYKLSNPTTILPRVITKFQRKLLYPDKKQSTCTLQSFDTREPSPIKKKGTTINIRVCNHANWSSAKQQQQHSTPLHHLKTIQSSQNTREHTIRITMYAQEKKSARRTGQFHTRWAANSRIFRGQPQRGPRQ